MDKSCLTEIFLEQCNRVMVIQVKNIAKFKQEFNTALTHLIYLSRLTWSTKVSECVSWTNVDFQVYRCLTLKRTVCPRFWAITCSQTSDHTVMMWGDKWGEVSNECSPNVDNVKKCVCVCAHPSQGGPQGVEHLVKNLHEFHPVAVIDSHLSTEASRCNWKVAAAGARPHRPHAQSWCSSCSVWPREAAARRRAVDTVSDLSRFWSSLGCGILLVSVFFPSPPEKLWDVSGNRNLSMN